MKHINEKHEVIIYSEEKSVKNNPKNGETCEHYNRVRTVEFYYQKQNSDFIKVKLTRDFILDLAEQIKNIEDKTFEMEYFPDVF